MRPYRGRSPRLCIGSTQKRKVIYSRPASVPVGRCILLNRLDTDSPQSAVGLPQFLELGGEKEEITYQTRRSSAICLLGRRIIFPSLVCAARSSIIGKPEIEISLSGFPSPLQVRLLPSPGQLGIGLCLRSFAHTPAQPVSAEIFQSLAELLPSRKS